MPTRPSTLSPSSRARKVAELDPEVPIRARPRRAEAASGHDGRRARFAGSSLVAVGWALAAACGPDATFVGMLADPPDAGSAPDAAAMVPPPAAPDAGTAPPPMLFPDPTKVDPDAGPSFVTAAHPLLPAAPNNGGPLLARPQLVVITYANDPNRATLEAHARWMVSSDWLAEIGAEYGVGRGSILGTVERTDNAPTAITDGEIKTLLANGISGGTLPTPPGGSFANTLYMIYFPQQTTVTIPAPPGSNAPGDTSCAEFGGYHDEATVNGQRFAYAVIPACPDFAPPLTTVEAEQIGASHELAEAATDPFVESAPGFAFPPNTTNAFGLLAGEVGDLCWLPLTTNSVYREGQFLAQRIYSNAAARAGDRDPCLPALPAFPYFTVSVPGNVVAAPGSSTTVPLTAWSTAAVAPWAVRFIVDSRSDFKPILSATPTSMNNGDHANLVVGIPASATANNAALVLIESQDGAGGGAVWPMFVVAQ